MNVRVNSGTLPQSFWLMFQSRQRQVERIRVKTSNGVHGTSDFGYSGPCNSLRFQTCAL
jgi:hypothetical protein